MANPSIIEIPEWAWTKIATNVVSGRIHMLDAHVNYYQTYRLTGEAAPAIPTEGILPEEAVQLFLQSNDAVIASSDQIDVYLLAADRDDDLAETGKIRLDL